MDILIKTCKDILFEKLNETNMECSYEVIEKLSRYINHHFLKLIQTSQKFASIEGRDIIEDFDFNQSLFLFKEHPLIITSNIIPPSMKTKKQTAKTFSENLQIIKPLPVLLKAHWLSIDGVQPVTIFNDFSISNICPDQLIFNSNKNTLINSKKSEKENFKLTKEQKEYFNQIVSIFDSVETENSNKNKNLNENVKNMQNLEKNFQNLAKNKQNFQNLTKINKIKRNQFLKSLRCDPFIDPLIPLFIEYISSKISQWHFDYDVVDLALDFVKAIVLSNNFNVNRNMHKIIPILMLCVLKPQLCQTDLRHFELREKAAFILYLIVLKQDNPNFKAKLLQSVYNRLFVSPNKLSLPSCFGLLTLFDLLSEKEAIKTKITNIINIALKAKDLVKKASFSFNKFNDGNLVFFAAMNLIRNFYQIEFKNLILIIINQNDILNEEIKEKIAICSCLKNIFNDNLMAFCGDFESAFL